MVDLADEVPQRAFINAEIFQLALKTGALDCATYQICKKYNLSEYSVENPAYVLSLLYCLIVFPKELWKHSINIEMSESINSKYYKIIDLFEISAWENRPKDQIVIGNRYSFIDKMRNSISHANIKIDSDMNFIFIDKNNGKINFYCSANILNVMEFLSKIGAMLANIRSHKIPTGILPI